jgi:cytochrome d ubiquinol oxidase subunit II
VIGLVFGYALLGAGWLVLKPDGALYDWVRWCIPWLAGCVLAALVASTAAAALDERMPIASNWVGHPRRPTSSLPLWIEEITVSARAVC